MSFPSLTALNASNQGPQIGVPFAEIDPVTSRWKVRQLKREEIHGGQTYHELNAFKIVTFELHPQFIEGIQPGMIRLFDVNMGELGSIAIRPYYHTSNREPTEPSPVQFAVWDADHPFERSPQLLTLQYTLQDRYNGFQESARIFENVHLAKILQVAQFVIQQRVALFIPMQVPKMDAVEAEDVDVRPKLSL